MSILHRLFGTGSRINIQGRVGLLLTASFLFIHFPLLSQTDSSVFGQKEHLKNAMEGKIYLLPENTQKLPAFDTMKTAGKVYAKTIDIPGRSWQDGFPGITNRFEWFAVVYTGSFVVKKPGHYHFRLNSDDGSKLFIDDSLVINNDGLHGESSVSGDFNLDKKYHHIKVEYFQGPRYNIALQLFDNPDGEQEHIFPGPFIVLQDHGTRSCWLWWLLAVIIVLIIIIILVKRRKKRGPSQIKQ